MRALGNSRWRRAIAAGLAVLALAALLLQPARAQSDLDAAAIRLLVEGLQNGTLSFSHASAECTRGLAEETDNENVRQVMATYLDVPDSIALSAFCDGLMRAIVSKDLGVDSLLAVNRKEPDATMLREFGRILRAVYFAHRRTTSVSAEARVPQ
jgi:hypothetical protein